MQQSRKENGGHKQSQSAGKCSAKHVAPSTEHEACSLKHTIRSTKVAARHARSAHSSSLKAKPYNWQPRPAKTRLVTDT